MRRRVVALCGRLFFAVACSFCLLALRGRLHFLVACSSWSLALSGCLLFAVACDSSSLALRGRFLFLAACSSRSLAFAALAKRISMIKTEPKMVSLCEVTFGEGVGSPIVCGFSCRSCCCCYCRFFLPLKPKRHLRLSKQPGQCLWAMNMASAFGPKKC